MSNYIFGPNYMAHDVTEADRPWLESWLNQNDVANTFHYATNELPGVYKDLAWVYSLRSTQTPFYVAIAKISNRTITYYSTSTHPSLRGNNLPSTMFPEVLGWWKTEGSQLFGVDSFTIVSHPPYKRAYENSPGYPWVTVEENGNVWHERIYFADL